MAVCRQARSGPSRPHRASCHVLGGKDLEDVAEVDLDRPIVSAARSTALALVHVYVYDLLVKRRELESRLRELGWTFLRHGGSHDVWTDGERLEYLPRHAEINENLARKILRKAQTKKKETDS